MWFLHLYADQSPLGLVSHGSDGKREFEVVHTVVDMVRMSPHLSCTAAYWVGGQKCLVIEGKFCLGTKNYPSANRAWKDDSVLYTLMPLG
jgi:hypothetical protein